MRFKRTSSMNDASVNYSMCATSSAVASAFRNYDMKVEVRCRKTSEPTSRSRCVWLSKLRLSMRKAKMRSMVSM